jgi:hypothetical protein
MQRLRTAVGLAALVHLVSFASPVRADEIHFVNGDRLTGRIVSMTSGALVFDAALAGEVKVELEQVATLSSDEQLEIHTSDGSVLHAPAIASREGEFRTGGSTQVGPQTLALADTVSINPPPVQTEVWSGRITAGMTLQRGNTYKNEARAELDTRRRTERSRTRFRAIYDGERTRSSSGVKTTTDRNLFGELFYDHDMSGERFWYAHMAGEKDGPTDLNLRFQAGGGFGYRWFYTDVFHFSTRAGLNWVSENYADDSADEDYAGFVLRWEIERDITDRFEFFQDGSFLQSLQDRKREFSKIETGLRTPLTDALFLEGKMIWEWDSEPSSESQQQDVDYVFSLGYRF